MLIAQICLIPPFHPLKSDLSLYSSTDSYTKSAQIYVCPSDTQGQNSGNSYAANHCLGVEDGLADGANTGKNLAAFQTPTSVLLLGEETHTAGALESTDDGWLGYAIHTPKRHLEGSNVSFLDGHVKWYRPDKIEADQLFSRGNGGGNNCAP